MRMSQAPIEELLEQTRAHRVCLAELVEMAASGRGPELAESEGRFQGLVQGFSALRQRMIEYREQQRAACAGNETADQTAALSWELEQCRRLVSRLDRLVTQAHGIRLRHWSPEPECAYTAGGTRPAMAAAGPRLVRQLA